MGFWVAHDAHEDVACLYCSTTWRAFGPVFTGPEAFYDAEEFLTWLKKRGAEIADDGGIPHTDGDPRSFTPDDLDRMRDLWRNKHDAEGEHQDEAKAKG